MKTEKNRVMDYFGKIEENLIVQFFQVRQAQAPFCVIYLAFILNNLIFFSETVVCVVGLF